MSIISLNAMTAVLSYFFGSISSAIIVCKIARLPDPRSAGSNNPGATNVLRIGGKKYAALTLLGDILKGFLPVIFVVYWSVDNWIVPLVALCAFLGHLYPIFFDFKGGKGIATAFGIMFGLYWGLGVLVGLVWLLVAGLFRYSSLAGILAVASAPFIAKFGFDMKDTVFWALLVICLFTVYRHRANVKRMLGGIESRIGQK